MDRTGGAGAGVGSGCVVGAGGATAGLVGSSVLAPLAELGLRP